jgi:hypothetical protein
MVRASGKTRTDDERPAEQVVEKGGALEEPGVLLVDEERDPGDENTLVIPSRHHLL